MRLREGCSLLAFGFLFVVVACLVFVALAGAMVLTGEVPLQAPYLTSFGPEPGYAFRPTTPITLTFDQMMDPDSVEAAFTLAPPVPGISIGTRSARRRSLCRRRRGTSLEQPIRSGSCRACGAVRFRA